MQRVFDSVSGLYHLPSLFRFQSISFPVSLSLFRPKLKRTIINDASIAQLSNIIACRRY